MPKFLVPVSIVGLLILCWVTGILSALPEDHSAQVAAYREFAEEQIALEAYGSAIDYYKAIVELEPAVENYSRLAEVYELAGKEEDAYETLDVCVQKYPQEKEIYQKIIKHYFDAGDYSVCVSYLEDCAAVHGWDEEMTEQYFQCKFRFILEGSGYQDLSDVYNGSHVAVTETETFFLSTKCKRMKFPDLEDASPDFGDLLGVTVDGRANFMDDTGLKYLDTTDTYDKTWSFSGGLALVQYGNAYGYVDRQFRLVLGELLDGSNFNNGVAAVRMAEGWTLVDSSLNRIGEEYYSDIKLDEDKFCSFAGRIFVKGQDGYRMVDTEGEPVGENVFEDAKPFNRGGYAAVKQNGLWGFVDTENRWVIEPKYEDAMSFGEQLGAVLVDGKWGFISSADRMVIEPQFEAVKHLNGSTAPVKQDGLWYMLIIEQ